MYLVVSVRPPVTDLIWRCSPLMNPHYQSKVFVCVSLGNQWACADNRTDVVDWLLIANAFDQQGKI